MGAAWRGIGQISIRRTGGASMSSEEFAMSRYFLEDNARLIAAGKIQRWEVVKWTVTFNLALAGVSASIKGWSTLVMLFLAMLIVILSLVMIMFFNWKMTKCRSTVADVVSYLIGSGVDVSKVVGTAMPHDKGTWYDDRELALFAGVVILSFAAPLFVAVVAAH
jgi:hypothetical protein